MKCRNCGCALRDDSAFCPHCGEAFSAGGEDRGDAGTSGETMADIERPQPGGDAPHAPGEKSALSSQRESAAAVGTAAPATLLERAVTGPSDRVPAKSEPAGGGGKKKRCKACAA